MSSPIDIPNAEQCRINHGLTPDLKNRIPSYRSSKKAKELWSEHGKNYSKKELVILAKAAGIPYILTYKKHELALKLGVENRENLKANPR